MKTTISKLDLIGWSYFVLLMAGFCCTQLAPQRKETIEMITSASSAWFLAISILLISIPYAFGSKETLARNSKLIGTQNLVAARVVCAIGVLFGGMLVLVAVFFTIIFKRYL